jgi:hypothetical protein
MAAFLTVDLLRAHVVPTVFQGDTLAVRRRAIPARCAVGSDSRLTCRWDTDTADPPLPPIG